MKIEKLTGTTAFIAIDLEGASCSAGIVRAAPRVLQGGAQTMARTSTYMFAVRELQMGGASAGINADDSAREEAVAGFVAAVLPRVQSGELVFDAGKGVDPSALAELAAHDPRSPLHRETFKERTLGEHLMGLGAVVAAEAAMGSLEGRRAAVEPGPEADSVRAALAERGVSNVVDDLDAEVDLLFCGSRQGMIDGATAESLSAQVVVPTGPHALSAKGFAVLRRRGVVALPDFVTISGPSFAAWPAGEATAEAAIAAAESTIAEVISEGMAHDDGPVLAACYRAEAFLSSWQDTLPFGRPLA